MMRPLRSLLAAAGLAAALATAPATTRYDPPSAPTHLATTMDWTAYPSITPKRRAEIEQWVREAINEYEAHESAARAQVDAVTIAPFPSYWDAAKENRGEYLRWIRSARCDDANAAPSSLHVSDVIRVLVTPADGRFDVGSIVIHELRHLHDRLDGLLPGYERRINGIARIIQGRASRSPNVRIGCSLNTQDQHPDVWLQSATADERVLLSPASDAASELSLSEIRSYIEQYYYDERHLADRSVSPTERYRLLLDQFAAIEQLDDINSTFLLSQDPRSGF